MVWFTSMLDVGHVLSAVNIVFFFFNDTATTEIYTLSLHDALPIWSSDIAEHSRCHPGRPRPNGASHAAPTCSSIGSAFFHNAKSRGSSLAYSSLATRAPTLISRRSSCDRRPYVGNFAIA